MDVLYLFVPESGPIAIGPVIREQAMIMLQMRTATASVGDDRVELIRRKLIELFSGELLGQFPFAIVRVERAATKLFRRRDHFATVACQHFDRVAVDVAK